MQLYKFPHSHGFEVVQFYQDLNNNKIYINIYFIKN